jgi:DNA repair protein RecO (recombination protein O)
MASRTYKTEAVVLRSMRLGEADRVLHLYTLDRGRVGAVAKGVRKTKSRFGGRLEPLSHVELMLHQGKSDLQTITGVHLLRPHHAAREDYYRLSVGLIGAEAMLRLFSEQEANERAFTALTRFLGALEELPRTAGRPALDPLALSFQLKLLWLSGYLPHLTSCAECGTDDATLVGYSPRAGGAVCGGCANRTEALALSGDGIRGIETLLASPLSGRVRGRPDGTRLTRRAARRHRELRVPRWLPPADAQRVIRPCARRRAAGPARAAPA